MNDLVGQQFGSYMLIRLLGEGGFAEVYLGEHLHLGTQAAIKVLQTRLLGREIDHFRLEARTIGHLAHPNIVRVLDFGVERGTPFLVMDYAPNGTLRRRHPSGALLSIHTILPYVRDVAEALHYAHQEKLIHRDIKPENMLVGRRNEVLLSDFGIAVVAQSSRYQRPLDIAGTVSYMAPEQLLGKPVPASDQYALGIVVYEWLSGTMPFQGSYREIASQHVLAPPPPLRQSIPALPAEVEQVVLKALAKEPKDRFADVRAFAHALEEASQADHSWLFAPTQVEEPSSFLTEPTHRSPPPPTEPSRTASPLTSQTQPSATVAQPTTPSQPTRPTMVSPGAASFKTPPVPSAVTPEREARPAEQVVSFSGAPEASIPRRRPTQPQRPLTGRVDLPTRNTGKRGQRRNLNATRLLLARILTGVLLLVIAATIATGVYLTRGTSQANTAGSNVRANVTSTAPGVLASGTAPGASKPTTTATGGPRPTTTVTGSPKATATTPPAATSTSLPSQSIIYIGSSDQFVYALRASDSSMAWRYQTGGEVRTAPTPDNGTIYVGSDDGYLYALRASDGGFLWRFKTGDFVRSTPAVANGIVYFASYDKNIYAVRASDGTLVWEYQTTIPIGSSPAVVNGVVYIGGGDQYAYALRASDGGLLWHTLLGGQVSSASPMVVNGVVYIGADDNYLYALQVSDGSQLWRFQTGGWITTTPMVVGGVVYLSSKDSFVYAINASDGSQRWSFQTGGSIDSSPMVVNGVVYVGCYDHFVYALNASDGSQRWRFQTGNSVLSSPLVVNAVLYIGSWDFSVYALRVSDGSLIWKYQTGSYVFSSPRLGP